MSLALKNQRQRSQRHQAAPTLHSMSGVLSVINPHVDRRGTLEAQAMEMVAARMAIAIRENPPHALQMALMQAYQRSRRRR